MLDTAYKIFSPLMVYIFEIVSTKKIYSFHAEII